MMPSTIRFIARYAAGILLATAVVTAAPASAATFTWIGSGSTANWSVGANWAGGVAPTSTGTHALVWDATSSANKNSLNDIGGLKISSIAYSNAPGVTLSGSALTMTANPFQTSSSGTITINLDMALAASTTQFADGSDIVINGVLSGGGASMSFNKPFYALYGANTFSGRVVLGTNNGPGIFVVNTLKNSGQSQSLGTGSVIQFGAGIANDNGRLYYTGGATSTDKVFQIGQDGSNVTATGGVYANGSGALTWTGTQSASTSTTNKTFTLGGFNTGANTWQSAIINNTGTISLTKAGRGTWVLSGASTFSGALAVNSGSLVLDYATNASVLSAANTLTMGGSTLEFKARSSGSSAQTLGNFTASTDTGISTVRVNQNGGSGMGVTLGTVTTTAGRSAVLFDLNGSAASSVTIGTAIAPDTGTDGKVLIRTAAGAYDFAVNGGSAATAVYARAATGTIGATNGSLTQDYVFTNTGSIGQGNTSTISAQSLRIAPTLDNQTMTITNIGTYAGGGQSGLQTDGGGLLYDGGSRNFTIAASGTNPNGVSIRAGNSGIGFVLSHMGTGTLTIGERVYLAYAGGTPGTGGQSTAYVGLFGTGLIDWKGSMNSNATGQLTVQGATVRISGTVDPVLLDSGTTGKGSMNIVLNGGGVLEAVNGNITRTIGAGAGAIQWKGDGGFSAFGGNRSVILAGGAAQTWGSTNFVPSDNALVLSSAYSDSTIDFQNALALGSLQRVVQVANGSAAIDARLSGVLSSGLTGGLVKAGDGTLELTGVNTYGGETWVQAGGLLVNGNQAGATGAMTVASGATLGGSGTTGGAITMNGILAPGSGGIGALAATNGVTWNASAGNAWLFQLGTPAASLNAANTSTNNDLLNVTGALSQGTGSTFTFDFLNSGSDGWYKLVDYTTTNFSTGTNNSFQAKANSLPAGKTATFVVDPTTTALYVQIVPEPSTLALLGVGGIALAAGLRRRRRPA